MKRLSVFGLAARGIDLDVHRSDADLLVEFEAWRVQDPYPSLRNELEQILGRKVDLIDKGALDGSQNYIRRSAILGDAKVVYGPVGQGRSSRCTVPGVTAMAGGGRGHGLCCTCRNPA